MNNKWLLISFYLVIILHRIKSREFSLHCWQCEVTIQSSNQSGVFLDNCQAQFDFTQHRREKCNGKCWKSVDLINTRLFENNSQDRLLFKRATFSQLKSSRRCFSADELIRASDMGMNTSDGCRQIRKDGRKMKEVCFCSDEDMCNNAIRLTNNFFILLNVVSFVYLNKLYSHY